MFGLCARAGKLITGENAVIKLIRSGQAKAAFIDETIAPNGRKSITDACAYYDVRLLTMPEGTIGLYSGREGRMSAATADASFASRIIEIYENHSGVY